MDNDECPPLEEQFNCDLLVTIFHALVMDATLVVEAKKAGEEQIDLHHDFEKVNWSKLAEDPQTVDIFQQCFDYLLVNVRKLLNNTYMNGALGAQSCPVDPLWRINRVNQVIFFNVLKENNLISSRKERYYESVLDIFHYSLFGATFYLKVVTTLNWYTQFADTIFIEESRDHRLSVIRFFNGEIDKMSLNQEKLQLQATLFTAVTQYVHLYGCDNQINEVLANLSVALTQFFDGGFTFGQLLEAFNRVYRGFCEHFIAATLESSSKALKLDEDVDIHSADPPNFHKLHVVLSPIVFDAKIEKNYQKHMYLMETLLQKLLTYSDDEVSVLPHVSTEIKSMLGLHDLWSIIMKAAKDSSEVPNLILPLFDRLVDKILKKQDIDITNDYSFFGEYLQQQKAGHKYAVLAAVKHAKLNEHKEIFEILQPVHLTDPRLLLLLANRLECSNDGEKSYFGNLFTSALKSVKDPASLRYYGQLHLYSFHVKTIGSISADHFRVLLNKVPVLEKNSHLYRDIKLEMKIAAFLNPLGVMNFLMQDVICSKRKLHPFVVDLLSSDLYDLCSVELYEDNPDETLLIAMINDKLKSTQSPEEVGAIIELIKAVHGVGRGKTKTKWNANRRSVIPLESLFYVLINEDCLSEVTAVRNKVLTMKLIVNLSDGEKWSTLSEFPAPFLYYMLQFIDFYWYDGSKKQDILILLDHIVHRKLQRKLQFDELKWICDKLVENEEDIILVAYLESCLELKLPEIFEISESFHNEMVVLAAISSDHEWMFNQLKNYGRNIDGKAVFCTLSRVMRFLTKNECKNVFRFLEHYFWDYQILDTFCRVVATQTAFEHDVNTSYALACISELVTEFVVTRKAEKPISKLTEEEQAFVHRTNFNVFKAISKINYATMTKEDEKVAESLTMKVAKLIEQDHTPLQDYYSEELFNVTHPLAKDVLVSVFGQPKPKERKETITFLPV